MLAFLLACVINIIVAALKPDKSRWSPMIHVATFTAHLLGLCCTAIPSVWFAVLQWGASAPILWLLMGKSRWPELRSSFRLLAVDGVIVIILIVLSFVQQAKPAGKAVQALTATCIGTGLVSVRTLDGSLLIGAAALALYVIPIIILGVGSSREQPAREVESDQPGSISPPLALSMCGGNSMTRVMQLGDLFKITEGASESGGTTPMSVRSPYSSMSGDLLLNMQGVQIHQLLHLAKQSMARKSEDKALEDKLLTPHPAELELQNMPLQQLLHMAKITLQRASNSSSQMLAMVEEAKRSVTQRTVATSDSEVQTDLLVIGSVSQGRSSLQEDSSSGVWREVVEMLQKHSSEIAHDMKNPLNGVLALSQNVVVGVFGELPQVAIDQLNVVRSCAYHLLNMINMTRDMMKMLACGDAEASLNITTLENSVEEVLKRMSAMVGTRLTITYNKDSPQMVIADDSRLYQVVHCVMANAFKYTRKGGVTMSTEESSDKRYLTFKVTDTGTGFNAEQLEKFNSPLMGTSKEEMGLGLCMVKRLMALFGGILKISNRPEGGALVELAFKADRNAPDLSSVPPRSIPSSSPAGPAASLSSSSDRPKQPSVPSRTPPVAPALPKMDAISKDNISQNRRTSTASPGHLPESVKNANDSGSGRNRKSQRISDAGIVGDEPMSAKVLIVDDDPVNLNILEDLLRSAGYEIITAATGTEALEVFVMADPPVQLVLLDVTLPDLSGHEVCLKMRTLIPGIPPPIIMISGKASTKDVIKGLQAGSCDYITKPFQPQEVLARVETQLRLYMGEVQQLQETAERNMALLSQVLPPHVLLSLKGGSRLLVEKFNDVCMMRAEIVNFAELAGHADTADCILTLNRIYSTFDSLVDKYRVHKVDVIDDAYVAAVGHLREDHNVSPSGQVRNILDCAREMLEVVRCMSYPPTLGKMELRIGVHVGPVFAGVVGVKFPRYTFFGTTVRLTKALNQATLPMTIHLSEMAYQRVKGTGDKFVNFTQSNFSGMGIVRTLLLVTENVDLNALQAANVGDFLAASTIETGKLQIMQTLVGITDHVGGGVLAGSTMPSQPSMYSVYKRGLSNDLSMSNMTAGGSNLSALANDMAVLREEEDQLPLEHARRSPSRSPSSLLVSSVGAAVHRMRSREESFKVLGTDDTSEDGIKPQGPRSSADFSERSHDPNRKAANRDWTHVDKGLLEQLGMNMNAASSDAVLPTSSQPWQQQQLQRVNQEAVKPPVVGKSPRTSDSGGDFTSKGNPTQPSEMPRANAAPRSTPLARGSGSSAQLNRLVSDNHMDLDSPGERTSPIPYDETSYDGPETPSELLTHLGIGYYAKAVEAHGLSLAQLADLDDAGLRKVGLITVRSRQAVVDELRRLGLKQ